MHVLPASLSVYQVHTVPKEARRGHGGGASGAGVIAGCKPPFEYRRWNWGTWQEQPGLLTTVPSLQIIQCLAL